MTISLVKNDETKPSLAQFCVTLKKWDENGMKLKIDFGNPLTVSQGKNNDKVKMQILSPEYFTSKQTGQIIDLQNMDPLGSSVTT